MLYANYNSWSTRLLPNSEAIATIKHPKKRGCSEILYNELIDSFTVTGCPICRLVRKAEEKAISMIMYERINDPSTRDQLLRSNGFCPYHAWMIVELYNKGPSTSIEPLGLTIIYADLLKHVINRIKIDKIKYDYERTCIICRIAQEAEDSYLNTFTNCINQRLLKEYSTGTSILCLKHYTLLYSNLYKRDSRLAEKLKNIQLNKLHELYRSAANYILKADYKSSDKPSHNESTAWYRILEFINGYKTSIPIKSC